MKKILGLIVVTTLSTMAVAQDNGMGNHNGNSSGNYSFSGTQMLLGAILLVLIIGGVVWFLNNSRKAK
ncbi:MAG: hypothetical protein V4539_15955 [Bacteroidota bacterium]